MPGSTERRTVGGTEVEDGQATMPSDGRTQDRKRHAQRAKGEARCAALSILDLGRETSPQDLPKMGLLTLGPPGSNLSIGYCAGWGGTTAQPRFGSLARVAVADWMDVSAAILGKVLMDSGVRAQSGMPSTS